MSIYEIQNGSYRAYRVAVGVGGELKQKYFGLSKCKTYTEELAAYNAAVKQNEVWIKERDKQVELRKKKAKPIKRKTRTDCCTAVRGVQLVFTRETKKHGFYMRPSIMVCVAEGTKYFSVKSCGYKQGWKNAIKGYCKLKNIKRVPKELLDRMPDKTHWENVKRHYKDNLGWDVPDTVLDFAD